MMVQSSDELAVSILKRIQESVSCGICQNIITNPMRNHCGHRFCYYCIVNALEPTDEICNCPKCNAAVNRNRLVQDVVFGNVVNKAGQLIDSIRGSDLSDKPNGIKDASPLGKRRLPTERYEDIDLDKSIEETEAEAREMARDVGGNKGTKRPLEAVNEPIESVKRSFVMPKTSTPTGSGKERELSPFPVSFLNKFTLQADKRPSDKTASPSPKRPLREPLHRKLSFEGDERREMLMSDSSDSEDRRIRTGATYSRFDRVKQSIKKNNGVQTEIVPSDKKNQFQQTDGSNKSDLYSNLSNLFNCLCTQQGISGSIIIEGIGRFEINLSKTIDKTNSDQIVQSPAVLKIDKLVQTDPPKIEKKPTVKEIGVNTIRITTKESEMQTELLSNDNIEKPVSPEEDEVNETNDTQVMVIDEQAQEEEEEEDNEEPALSINLNGTTKHHYDKLGELEVTHEVTSISQIVREFSEDPIHSQEDDDEDGTRYDHVKASTRISALGKVNETHDEDATEIVTQMQTTKSINDPEESDLEDDPPRKSVDEESNIVLESDEDDKFLMSCVFDTLDDDDEIESVRSMATNSDRSTGLNLINSSRNLGESSGSEGETRSRLSRNSRY